jgi:hypothetical protein
MEFGRLAAEWRHQRGQDRSKTFDFLGFTHCRGTDREEKFQLVRLTAKKRMRTTLTAIRDTLHQRWHEPVPPVGAWLQRVLNGYFAYYAVPNEPVAIGRLPQRGLPRLAERPVASEPNGTGSTGLVFIRLTRQVRPALPGSSSYPEEHFCTHGSVKGAVGNGVSPATRRSRLKGPLQTPLATASNS